MQGAKGEHSYNFFQEHPYLGRPFYQLHPCHTANLMEQVISIEDPNKR